MTKQIQDVQRTILVVDDDEYSQDLARLTLGKLGYTNVQVAQDGRLGLLTLDSLPQAPAFLICDIFMPNSDGIEFVSALVQRRFAGGVILISGGDSTMLGIARIMAANGGLNLLAVLKKPLNAIALAHALSSLVPTAE
jgi:CheY-like chemotaxis protein